MLWMNELQKNFSKTTIENPNHNPLLSLEKVGIFNLIKKCLQMKQEYERFIEEISNYMFLEIIFLMKMHSVEFYGIL